MVGRVLPLHRLYTYRLLLHSCTTCLTSRVDLCPAITHSWAGHTLCCAQSFLWVHLHAFLPHSTWSNPRSSPLINHFIAFILLLLTTIIEVFICESESILSISIRSVDTHDHQMCRSRCLEVTSVSQGTISSVCPQHQPPNIATTVHLFSSLTGWHVYRYAVIFFMQSFSQSLVANNSLADTVAHGSLCSAPARMWALILHHRRWVLPHPRVALPNRRQVCGMLVWIKEHRVGVPKQARVHAPARTRQRLSGRHHPIWR